MNKIFLAFLFLIFSFSLLAENRLVRAKKSDLALRCRNHIDFPESHYGKAPYFNYLTVCRKENTNLNRMKCSWNSSGQNTMMRTGVSSRYLCIKLDLAIRAVLKNKYKEYVLVEMSEDKLITDVDTTGLDVSEERILYYLNLR